MALYYTALPDVPDRTGVKYRRGMATILMPLPDRDFDVTEVAVPWKLLTEAGHSVVFATEAGATPRGSSSRGIPLGCAVYPRCLTRMRSVPAQLEQSDIPDDSLGDGGAPG
jgi:putative intracellular protease/amidase